MHSAAYCGQLDIIDYFIKKHHCDPKNPGWICRTPLHYSAESGHLNLLKHLISEYNCDPEIVDDHGDTPLHLAAMSGHINIVKHLTLEQNCNPLTTDNYGNTPLHDAARNGHLKVVKFLVETLHCPIHVKGSCSKTPLEWAFFKGHFHVVWYFKEFETNKFSASSPTPQDKPLEVTPSQPTKQCSFSKIPDLETLHSDSETSEKPRQVESSTVVKLGKHQPQPESSSPLASGDGLPVKNKKITSVQGPQLESHDDDSAAACLGKRYSQSIASEEESQDNK